MAISNELSGDIAAAILCTQKKSPREMSDLKETVLRIHSILQRLSDQERRLITNEGSGGGKQDAAFKAGV